MYWVIVFSVLQFKNLEILLIFFKAIASLVVSFSLTQSLNYLVKPLIISTFPFILHIIANCPIRSHYHFLCKPFLSNLSYPTIWNIYSFQSFFENPNNSNLYFSPFNSFPFNPSQSCPFQFSPFRYNPIQFNVFHSQLKFFQIYSFQI